MATQTAKSPAFETGHGNVGLEGTLEIEALALAQWHSNFNLKFRSADSEPTSLVVVVKDHLNSGSLRQARHAVIVP